MASLELTRDYDSGVSTRWVDDGPIVEASVFAPAIAFQARTAELKACRAAVIGCCVKLLCGAEKTQWRGWGDTRPGRDGKERIGPNEPISEDFRDRPCCGRFFSWKCGSVADLDRSSPHKACPTHLLLTDSDALPGYGRHDQSGSTVPERWHTFLALIMRLQPQPWTLNSTFGFGSLPGYCCNSHYRSVGEGSPSSEIPRHWHVLTDAAIRIHQGARLATARLCRTSRPISKNFLMVIVALFIRAPQLITHRND